ncbi:LysR substrate-binding domain-containing protein [Ruegeria lacuscaerulensis]|uniref:LysR substrate-binding domain-containing protein n=1 Tax=Ruegeria lacuscaerulensis TaxID=55218 RepID=UPI0014807B8A|nr:LysR substrate-binding domain-containing protein [Ruegeria lacuscaerulensis]
MLSEKRKEFMPPLHWLRAFSASARHLSFTDAAQELLITQSAVSKQVRLLEQALGQQLFIRRHRGLNLTEAGRNYLPIVDRAFNTLEQGTRSFLGYSAGRNLHLKVNYSFASFWLMDCLDEFMDAHPDVQLTVSTALWEREFLETSADIEIHYGREETFRDGAIRLRQEMLMPVCAPEVAARLNTPDDLNGERILDLTGISETWDFWIANSGVKGLDLNNRHYFSTYVLALKMAQAGKGVTMAHTTLVERAFERGDLVAPFDCKVVGRDGYFLIRNKGETANPHAAQFVDWIQAKFNAGR